MSLKTPAIGLVLGTSIPPEGISEAAAASERIGFDELWLLEDYFFTGSMSAATAALSSTDRLPVGIGIASAMVRHPAVLAMEIATIARMFPGRFYPGIGLGAPAWLDQMGLRPKAQLSALRDCLTAVRDLLAGATVTRNAFFQFKDVSLTYPLTAPTPLYMGVIARKGLALSGEIADGTILSVLAGEAYVAWARQQIEAGRQSARRLDPHRVTAFAIFSVDRRTEVAKQSARSVLAFYLSVVGRSALTDAYGISDELEDMLRRGANHLEREMPARWLDDLAVAGDPEECAEKIRRLWRAGAESVVLLPTPVEHALEIALFAGREVLGRLR